MNPDLHMAGELKNTGKGNLFVVFGEPDIDILDQGDDTIALKVNGIDVFDPNTGDIRSGDTKSIAAWFIDTDYNEESFFVRHAYFLGANDPYKALKTALAPRSTRTPGPRSTATPRAHSRGRTTGRIAVKVHQPLRGRGDEGVSGCVTCQFVSAAPVAHRHAMQQSTRSRPHVRVTCALRGLRSTRSAHSTRRVDRPSRLALPSGSYPHRRQLHGEHALERKML